jgi:chromosome segregation ATPase
VLPAPAYPTPSRVTLTPPEPTSPAVNTPTLPSLDPNVISDANKRQQAAFQALANAVDAVSRFNSRLNDLRQNQQPQSATELNQALDHLANTRRNLSEALANQAQNARNLGTTTNDINNLVSQINSATNNNNTLSTAVNDLTNQLQNATNTRGNLDKQLNDILNAIANAQKAVDDAKNALDNATNAIASLQKVIADSQAALDNAPALIRQSKDNLNKAVDNLTNI